MDRFVKTYVIVFVIVTAQVISSISESENLDEDVTNKGTSSGASREGRLLFPFLKYKDVPSPKEKFDFIIIGSGSAGSVLANRLSENPDWNVLLLEVGGEATPLTDIPVLAPAFQFTALDWNYTAEPHDGFCRGCPNGRMHWPRGRALGGSSVINYMIHIRGNPIDYERWAAAGNPGWSWKEVLPYFIKMEDANIEIQDPEYHQKGGYLSVGDVQWRSKSVHAFVQSCQQAGYKYVDYNGKEQMGVSYVQATLRRGKRCSAERAYIDPVRNRKNLKISLNSRVVKILINPETNTAYGVKYVRNRQYHTAFANKEVILSAGALASPQLLMLSGIGPKSHLEDLDIEVLKDLPVGKKLYDHITFAGLIFEANETITPKQQELYNPKHFIDLVTHGRSILSNLGGVEGLAYLKTNVSTDPENYPDMELIFIGGSLATDDGQVYRKTFSISDETYNKFFKPVEGKSVWQVIPMLVHPKSSGFLKLKSKNPYHFPKFYPNYFTDPENHDIKTFIAAIREVQRISKSPAFQRYGSTQYKMPVPGCEQHNFDSDVYWECALRHITPTLHHQIGTCKMGPAHDPDAMVDNKLRVYGIKNLRVADTSIIPFPLTAHTNVPAYMVGEKASDIIKMEWESENLVDPGDLRRKGSDRKKIYLKI